MCRIEVVDGGEGLSLFSKYLAGWRPPNTEGKWALDRSIRDSAFLHSIEAAKKAGEDTTELELLLKKDRKAIP